jgi:hypothetical protein
MSNKLCVLALAALTLAAIASRVVAEPRPDTNIPLSAGNAFSGEANNRPYGYGSIPHLPAGRRAAGVVIEPAHHRILDCIHMPFPQCDEGL